MDTIKTYYSKTLNAWCTVPEDEIVEPEFACPKCQENRVDELVFIDGGLVYCQICGTEYDID